MSNLLRYTAFPDLREELDRMIEQFAPRSNGDATPPLWSPRTDVAETEEAFVVTMDVPGLKKEDIELNVHNQQLIVSGQRELERKDENRRYHRIERSYGHFTRTLNLPEVVNVDNINAQFEDGVLTITVPKAEESKPRRIEIS